MLRPIINDLGVVLPDGLDDAAWVVNAYLIAFVAIMPIAGRISDVIGRRRTFLLAYLVFLVGTIWIPLAPSFGTFLAGRVLTAIGGGAMVPVALAVVGDVYPERQRARALGTLGAIETMGWVWGPLYGAVLVRFLTWRWQFWLNVPLAVAGLVAVWWALADHDRPRQVSRVGWPGAALLTAALVSLSLALLGGAEVQSVTGLDQLTGGSGPDLRWLYPVAAVAGAAFVWQQRRSETPLVDPRLLRGRHVRVALLVNFVVGAALVIAMVDVPLFVNAVEVDLERSAIVAGWILSALTAAMAIASYVGGRITERTWYGPPITVGLLAATAAYVLMGVTWTADSPTVALAAQLALLGTGFGLTIAPTTSAVVDHAHPDRRGAAAAIVMVVRLIGLSVGLSALTAWGLARFNRLRADIELPPLTDPDFDEALQAASAELTSQAIAETFVATAIVLGAGLLVTVLAQRRPPSDQHQEIAMSDHDRTDPLTPPIGRPDAAARTIDEHDEPSTIDEHGEPSAADGQAAATGDEPAVPPAESWLQRRLGVVVVASLAAIVVLAGAVVALAIALVDTRDELQRTRADVERVEAGAALFASQVTGFQQQLADLSPNISAGLDDAVAGLEQFATSTLEFTVDIDETVEIGTEVAIDRTVSVPIETTLPINESFDTTIVIDGPLGTELPLDVTVPVDIEVPIDLTVDIPINETIPLDAEVPVELSVPLSIEVSETELAALSESLATGLESFREVLAGLGG